MSKLALSKGSIVFGVRGSNKSGGSKAVSRHKKMRKKNPDALDPTWNGASATGQSRECQPPRVGGKSGNIGAEDTNTRKPEPKRAVKDPSFAITETCGVIDRGHLNPSHAGAFIDAVRAASDRLTELIEVGKPPKDGQKIELPPMESSGAGMTPTSAAIKATLYKPLTKDQVNGVALHLFKQQALDFEEGQEHTDWISGSSFSGEDLPSNLLSFHRAVFDLSEDDVMDACEEQPEKATDTKPKMAKNKEFVPLGWNKDEQFPPPDLGSVEEIKPGPPLFLYDVGKRTVSTGFVFKDKNVIDGTDTKSNQATYEVRSGDSLWKIAEEELGDGTQWSVIAKLNDLADPYLIRPGDVLKLPKLKGSRKPKGNG